MDLRVRVLVSDDGRGGPQRSISAERTDSRPAGLTLKPVLVAPPENAIVGGRLGIAPSFQLTKGSRQLRSGDYDRA
ncbi:hypothetical protein KXR53_01950 [Inquilinus limosus]|uniref:hypothetical protein n=1 Tax=Inquilinus limosus TaxID=171674 RepID=UPI003F17FA33